MSAADAKQVMTAFYTDFNAGRGQDAFARLAPDVKFELIAPPPVGGLYDRDGLGRFFGEVMAPAMQTPLQVKILGMVAEGDRVAIETEGSCVNVRGVPYNNRYHTLAVVRDGVIVEMREYLDSALLQIFLDV